MNCNNVNFINNTAKTGSAIYFEDIIINNSEFNDNAGHQGVIYCRGNTIIENTNFSNLKNMNFSFVYGYYSSSISINNCNFFNSTSKYATAIYAGGIKLNVKNSIFSNLTAQLTGGAIALKSAFDVTIENCTFYNTTSVKNGGAINNDGNSIFGSDKVYLNIINCSFTNCKSGIGGAIVQLGGEL